MSKRKTMEPKELTESEKEELIRLRAENEYIKTAKTNRDQSLTLCLKL